MLDTLWALMHCVAITTGAPPDCRPVAGYVMPSQCWQARAQRKYPAAYICARLDEV